MGLLRRSDSDGYCPKGRIQLPTSDEAEIHFQRQAFVFSWLSCCFNGFTAPRAAFNYRQAMRQQTIFKDRLFLGCPAASEGKLK